MATFIFMALCWNIILYLQLCLCVHFSNNFLKISALSENTSSGIVFNEVLAAAGRDITTKDVSRLRGGWPIQDAFYVRCSLHMIFIVIVMALTSCLFDLCICDYECICLLYVFVHCLVCMF